MHEERLMKLDPNEQRVMRRMAPGVYCREGFLGTDRRPLSVILDTDRSTLEGLGVTCEQIARRLGEILNAAIGALGAPVDVGEGLLAMYREAMGRIPSPFGDGVFPKGEVELTAPGGRVFRFTPLSVDMIARHGFFQGWGGRYRLEPADIARALGLA
jgi:hypothetical protein